MKRILTAVLLPLLLMLGLAQAQSPSAREERVVYHVNDSANALAALRYIRNHVEASPKAKIVLVAHGPGIDFLLDGAKDKNGNPYELLVQELASKKVQFRVCNNTLASRNIPREKVMPEASIVPSGVAELGRLQAQEGYVYITP